MATTSFPNTLIYECSSENASVKIAENEWVNEFKEGIDLKPGDTIRILGSFINEKGQGDQIEITEDNNKFTLEYIPIHNLYQYTKLSDDYTKPNDDTRTKVEKAQFSSILNVDKPKFYDGNGSPIYTFAAAKSGTDEAIRAERWYDLTGWNTYNNIAGYQNVNPNTQYYDCELIKNIACPHMDGIRLEWWDGVDSDNPNYIHQEIDFDIDGANPWGGPISPYEGDDINGNRIEQLAFASQWVSFKWNGDNDPTKASFTMELKDPFGVTGKVLAMRYTTNPLTYFDNYTDITFPKAAYPIATFMVGDHTQQTTIDPTMINPTGEDANRMGKGFTNATSGSAADRDFQRAKNGPYYNASNGPVDKNGRTWGIGYDTAEDIMFSGFSNGNDIKQDTPINYDFYCTGPNPYTMLMHNGDNGSNQSFQSPRAGIYYNDTTKKYYYQIRLSALPGNADLRRFLDEYYYAFLRPYNPANPQDTETIGDRVYLPISIAIPELTYNTGKDPDTVLTATEVGEGTPRDYTGDTTTANDFKTGGMKLGNWGFSELDNDSFKTICGDKYQQTIKPGFQTNIGMAILMSNQVKAQYGEPFEDPNFVEKVSRVAGGFPSTKYEEQLEDIRKFRQDCYMIQSKKANFEIPTGFYTSDRLANVINDLLHLNKEAYDNRIGKGQYTLSNKDNNWTYAPGTVNGPFIMTKIPEINGGIIAPDLSEDNIKNPSLSKRMPGLTLNQDIYTLETDTINVDGKTAAQIATGIDNSDGTIFTQPMRNNYLDKGQMIFCPAPPSLIEIYNTIEILDESRLIELNSDIISSNTPGLKLTTNFNKAWYDQCNGIAEREVPIFMGQGSYTAEGQKNDYSGTDFRPDKSGELGEGLIARVKNLPAGNVVTYDSPSTANTGYMFGFDPFANYNRTWGGLNTGGLSRFINGANDLTFLFDNDEERFAFSNSYTPFRPSGFESSKDKDEFSVDNAVPSVLINTLYDGYDLYAITQIYILSLAAPPVSKTSSNEDKRQGVMPTISDPVKQQAGAIELWESLGFTGLPSFTFDNGQYKIDSTRWIDDLYFQESLGENTGNPPIYNKAEINPSVNASNPSKSQCVITIPNRQFLVQTISEEFKANNPASLTTYPFYLIGSSIPSNFYHGSKTGTELPVVGLCSRNFSAGSFVFDLSQSSVEWTISENINLTSIRTKILKNDFSPATNLFGNSSIVYAITKANYYNEIPEPEATKIEQQREKEIEKETLAYDTQPIPVQPPQTYIMPSLVYQNLIDDDSD
mgnify:FL=1